MAAEPYAEAAHRSVRRSDWYCPAAARAPPTRSACSRRSRRCCRWRPIHFRSSSAPRPARCRRPCWAPRRFAGSARSRRWSTSGRTFTSQQVFRVDAVQHAALGRALDAVADFRRPAAAAATGAVRQLAAARAAGASLRLARPAAQYRRRPSARAGAVRDQLQLGLLGGVLPGQRRHPRSGCASSASAGAPSSRSIM